jgi:site-specific recombinase
VLHQLAGQPVAQLREVVALVRPSRLRFSAQFKLLVQVLADDEGVRSCIQQAVREVMLAYSPTTLLTETGINPLTPFFADLINRVKHKLLPEYVSPQELRWVVDQIFDRSWDHQWLLQIPLDLWAECFRILFDPLTRNITEQNRKIEERTTQELLNAVVLLSHEITAVGMNRAVRAKMPRVDDLSSPFLQQSKLVGRYFENTACEEWPRDENNPDYQFILAELEKCRALLQEIHSRKHELGISLNELYLLQRLDQCIARCKELMALLHQPDDAQFNRILAGLFLHLVVEENRKNSLRKMLEKNVQQFSAQLVEISGKTGEHYITHDLKGYAAMFVAALKGGFIVAFLTVFKTLIYYLHLPPLFQAVGYSLNYSLGFIGIHLARGTLATKQPAMTASRIAASIRDNPHETLALSVVIARVTRSQFIAFVGNAGIALPVAFGLSWLVYTVFGSHVATPEKALKMLEECDPFHSLALPHAAIAGLFLFLSGLIAGYFDNKVVYRNIPERIQALVWLHRLLGPRRTQRVAQYVGNNLGALAGNFFLGVFLGSIQLFGLLLGLPLDIRHITFASGNLGLALAELGTQVETAPLVAALLGIVGIGAMNFLVSFGLSFFVAMRARGLSLRQGLGLVRAISAYFYVAPTHFFFPPRREPIELDPPAHH